MIKELVKLFSPNIAIDDISIGHYFQLNTDHFKIDKLTFACLIATESEGNWWATRYEPAFYLRYLKNKTREDIFPEVSSSVNFLIEKKKRAISWGVCQVMGQTGRELGFKDEDLSSLILPSNSIYYGAKLLNKFIYQQNLTIDEALMKYNGGGDKEYVSRLRSRSNAATTLLERWKVKL